MFSSVILRFKNPKSYGVCLNKRMRDLAFSKPKAFLAWSMHQSIPAAPIPPPTRTTAGHLPALSAQEGHGHSWNWLMHYRDGEGKFMQKYYPVVNTISVKSRKNPWHPASIYMNIGEFSSSRGIHDSRWCLDSAPWILDSSYRILCQWNLNLLLVAFRINLHVAVFWNPKPRILDFTNNFPDAEILQAQISWIPGVRIPLHTPSFVIHNCHW